MTLASNARFNIMPQNKHLRDEKMIDNCLHCGSTLDIQEFCTKGDCPLHDYAQTTEFDDNWKAINATPFLTKQRVAIGEEDLGPELMSMKNSDSTDELFNFCNKILSGEKETDIKWQELAKWLLVNDIKTLTRISADRIDGDIILTLSSDNEQPIKVTASPDDMVFNPANPDIKQHQKGAYLHICTLSFASVVCNVEFGFVAQCVDEQKEIVINTEVSK